MNIAIVDDDVDFSSELQQYVIMFIERLYTRYEIDIINSDFFNELLMVDFVILEAVNGKKALKMIEHKEQIDGILLDLIMPEINGFGVIEELSKKGIMKKVPVMIISSEISAENENICFKYGVFDFIGRPFKTSIVRKRVQNMINIYVYKNHLEQQVQEQTAVLRKAYEKLEKQKERVEKLNKDILDMLGTIVEFRNLESGEHIMRVKGYTKILAEKFKELYPEYNLTDEMIDNIVEASALHDLGKISIPDKILLKPGRLTKEEFEYMKLHTVKGCELIQAVNLEQSEELKQICYDIIRYHHERYDGKGYPDGLKGDEIPVSAQLVSLADVYDALINERCYKDAFSNEKAFNMIMNGECGTFSPKLLETFKQVRDKFERFAIEERK